LEDVHATDTADVAQHTAQLHIHLDQHFLYPLDGAAGIGHQIASLPP
jgi:hypothetical protein